METFDIYSAVDSRSSGLFPHYFRTNEEGLRIILGLELTFGMDNRWESRGDISVKAAIIRVRKTIQVKESKKETCM